ncbi:HD domain-containing protein [Rubrobacter marinus]|uniref:bis(5'-nucleosyl)-tetraphosphatase (symmetrical) n=1 Tax=Rubrobacter marinus TaxID=2653852 RepID=A0A6G8Q197_9ACTN|nr:bis(5'-nucleosyl)-tetraphosphatase (symmetrical) YqeK [Rubrobacter marinus]QIN80218.1 HD domain-containing protein [Rubrobacter marinus]
MNDDRLLKAATGYARERLSDKRYDHTLRVAETAERLAGLHGLDPEKARLAGLLHDLARETDGEELLRIAAKNGVPVGDPEHEKPNLLHGPVAAVVARTELGVEDGNVLEAVRVHTTGAQGMGPLALVVFVADKIEPGREGEWVESLRGLAERDLKEAARASLESSISYTEERGRAVHPRSREALAWLEGQG